MEDSLHIIDEEYLWRYFKRELSPEEQKIVKEWINSSDENRKLAHDIEYLYRATDALKTMSLVDTEEALEKVKMKIDKPHIAKISVFVWFQRIAAILFLPLLIGSLYFMTKKDPVSYVEVFTNPGMVASFTLPDGSKVWLNSSSRLFYPEKFAGDVRSVKLEGEAYFAIHRDPSHRFVVNTPSDMEIEVLGTEFNVDAYKETKTVSTSLVSGSVKLTFRSTNQQIIMKPNEKVDYYVEAHKIHTNKACIEMLTSWKDGQIILRNTPLKEVLQILKKRFNADFIVRNKEFYNYSYTGVFEKQQINSVLEHLKISSNINYKYISLKNSDNTPIERLTVELY